MTINLSVRERAALKVLVEAGGAMLCSRIPGGDGRDAFGDVIPGMTVYLRLEKMGLLFFTEEEPLDLPGEPLDGFTFTPEVYITDEGRALLAAAR